MTKIKQSDYHQSIRGYFAGELYNAMTNDPDIWLLTGDLGFGMLDKIKKDFPDRFVNCGASEQAMVGIAIGLALEGKKPFCYSITSFLIYRAFETWKLYASGENIPIRGIGSGLDDDYKHDGASHHSFGVEELIKNQLPNICLYIPKEIEDVSSVVKSLCEISQPAICILKR